MASRRALVTGASSGIGREFAGQLARQGYVVTAVARREDKLKQLMHDLPGDEHSYLVADLANPEQLTRIVGVLAEQQFNLLINNAGFSALEPFYESSLEKQQNILAVNCGAVVTLAHAFLRSAQPGDALINLASIVSWLPTPAQPMYSASKAFIASFSECLWDEQRERGVYVMALCPGVTESEFISVATGGEADGSNMADIMVQSVESMVGEAMTALKKRRKAVVVTGRINRIMTAVMPRIFTRHRLIKVLSVMGDPEHSL